MVRQRGFVEEKMIKKMDAVGSCEELDVSGCYEAGKSNS